MALAIYDTIGDFYSWREIPRLVGVFSGYSGCTRPVLEDMLIVLRSTYADGEWITDDKSARERYFGRIAWDISATTGADYNGLLEFLNWVFVAAKGSPDVRAWFNWKETNPIYDFTTSAADTITQTASTISTAATDVIKFGYETIQETKKTLFGSILPVVAILGTCYLVKKVLD